jgi:hypothetical protein
LIFCEGKKNDVLTTALLFAIVLLLNRQTLDAVIESYQRLNISQFLTNEESE